MLLFLFIALQLTLPARGPDPEMMDARAGWSPPTYGTPVVYYVLQHKLDGGAWATVSTTTDTTALLVIPYAEASFVRIAGVDAHQRQGPYSLPSDPYNPSGYKPQAPTNLKIR